MKTVYETFEQLMDTPSSNIELKKSELEESELLQQKVMGRN